MELTALLPLLRSHGVKFYADGKLEIEFEYAGIQPHTGVQAPAVQPQMVLSPTVGAEASIPPDLRADDSMSYDKILNWSATPEDDKQPVAMTGDAPIEGAA